MIIGAVNHHFDFFCVSDVSGIDSQGKVLGNFEPSGFIPTFIEEVRLRGIKLSDDVFKK